MATSTGSNDFLVDADVLTDQNGIPHINQRRIKGLLKEYVKEVLEICGRADESEAILNHMFGEMGNHLLVAALETEDAVIENYDDCIATIVENKIPKSFVKNYFTKVIQQTAIDKKNHTAKKHSLRKIRAVKENVVFTSKISAEYENLIDIVALALLQWNLMGTQRNEGLGSVKIVFVLPKNTDELVQAVQEYTINESATEPISTLEKTYGENVKLNISLENKLILSRIQGDENIVNSITLIEGRVLWGYFAGEYLKQKGANENFHKIFNKGQVKFTSAYPKPNETMGTFLPMPLHIQFEKNNKTLTSFYLINIDPKIKTKAKSLYTCNNALYEVPRTIAFHLNRENNRISGTSTDGEIFYYEAINRGECFSAKIEGDTSLINDLLNTVFGGKEQVYGKIGRSKSVEYGKVEIKILNSHESDQAENSNEILTFFTFYFTSPCVVTNESGFAIPNINNLQSALAEAGIKGNITKAICRPEERQHFSGIWKSKTSLQHCFETGSAFKVELKEPMEAPQIIKILEKGIGLDTHLGLGLGKIHRNVESNFRDYHKSPISNKTNSTNHAIGEGWNKHKDKSTIRLEAIKMAKKYKPNTITNGQLSFIQSMIQKYPKWTEFKAYYETIKQRPVGEVIREKIRINYLFHEHELIKENEENFFELVSHYLKMCRLINNQNSSDKSIRQ